MAVRQLPPAPFRSTGSFGKALDGRVFVLVKLTGHREPDKRWDTPPAHSLRAGKLISPLKAYNNRPPTGAGLELS